MQSDETLTVLGNEAMHSEAVSKGSVYQNVVYKSDIQSSALYKVVLKTRKLTQRKTINKLWKQT